ncbi:MAG: thioesterase [Candidatus Aminicenantes bacterium]|nr:MAG: thioesterase [Candidatus Aminicenantes bacterium]
MKRIKLFCFPYAGGSSLVYSNWKDHLDKRILVYPVELAGRGRRIADPFYNSMDEAVEDVLRMIKYDLSDAPYAFFGHSMGTGVAYHTAQKIRGKTFPQPVHIFCAGRGAPHILRKDKPPYHTLPEDEFREKVMDLGGTPEEFFQQPELLEILLPLLRADFKISWEFTKFYHDRFDTMKPLDCNLTVFIGKEDDIKPEQIKGWKAHTTKTCTILSFDGGHFFLNHREQKEMMLKIINDTLLEIVNRRIPVSA